MKTTNKFDRDGNEIFVGDKVMKQWGWFKHNGDVKTHFQIHTIVEKDAHMMGNGQMHDDGDGKIFCLGRTYNFWNGNEVKKLTDDEVAKIGMPDDTDFFFDDDNNATRYSMMQFLVPND